MAHQGRQWRNRGDSVTLIWPLRIVLVVFSLGAGAAGLGLIAAGGFVLWIIVQGLATG